MAVLGDDEADGGGLHKQWVQFPTEIVSLHTEGNGELGLNAQAMLAWWRAFRTAHQQALHGESGYQFVSTLHNCASIVMRALIAGEAAFFLKPPAPWVTFSPRDVADYAVAPGRREVALLGQILAAEGVVDNVDRLRALHRPAAHREPAIRLDLHAPRLPK